VVTKEQRRRQLAREKFERQQNNRVQSRRKSRTRNLAIVAAVAVIAALVATTWIGGVFDSSDSKSSAAGTPSAATTSAAPDPCAKPAAGSPGTQQWSKEPAMTIDTKTTYTFTLQTTCGTIAMTLDAAKAPHTVNTFKFLADQGYFDHTVCHRLVDTGIYVLQCGDPTGQGSGGPGFTIPDENLSAFGKAASDGSVTYPAGTIAMANTGTANTGGSQFFLVYKDSPLAPSYTPFGTISSAGMTVLNKIAAAGAQPADPTTGNTPPNATVVINKATVAKD